jgi:hypothetical protein
MQIDFAGLSSIYPVIDGAETEQSEPTKLAMKLKMAC